MQSVYWWSSSSKKLLITIISHQRNITSKRKDFLDSSFETYFRKIPLNLHMNIELVFFFSILFFSQLKHILVIFRWKKLWNHKHNSERKTTTTYKLTEKVCWNKTSNMIKNYFKIWVIYVRWCWWKMNSILSKYKNKWKI